MSIQGKATAGATAVYAAQFPHFTYRPLNGWLVSEAGFGSYRISPDQDAHREALTHALSQGINLIDTSSNYADGGAESLIGEVLGELIGDGRLHREQLVIVSKGGYLQGSNYTLSQERKAAGNPFPDLVEYAEQLEHCIHPDFLAEQLTRSLERLNLQTLDVYLLHNPEYYLGWAQQNGVPLGEAWHDYYQRIRLAFQYLETEVGNGRIQAYGISSNSFPAPLHDPRFTSLSTVYGLAQAIGAQNGQHHFRVIQLPMNLFETGAVTEKNLSGDQNVLQFAEANGLGVLINRPLNAIAGNVLTRLADVPQPAYPASKMEVSTAVDISVRAERMLHEHILPQLPLDDETQQTVWEYLAVGTMLQGQWRAFGTYHNWRDIRSRFILPRAQSGTQFLANLENPPVEMEDWLNGYINTLNTALAAVTAFYQESGHKAMADIKQQVETADPDWSAATLSQTAVRALRGTTGVTAVLVGMRQKAYVNDVLAGLIHPITPQPREAAWQQMRHRG
ncbi:MAG: aldo/keto reductase [Chloroflexota bacterium]